MKQSATLRSDQTRKFVPSAVQPLGHDVEALTVLVPEDWQFRDVLQPLAWGNVAPMFAPDPANSRGKVGSLILASSPRFIAWLRIQKVIFDTQKNPAGLEVLCIGPAFDVATGKACAISVSGGEPWREG